MKIKLNKHAFWLKVMRFTLFPLILVGHFTIFSFANTAHGQDPLDKKISLSLENKEIGFVLKLIEAQADVKFAFSPQVIDVSQKISVKAQDEPLETIFKTVFKPLNIKYEVSGKYILLLANTDVPNIAQKNAMTVVRPPLSISGAVTDEKGAPLPGVSVVLKGTVTGTITDEDGKFSLEIPESKGSLIFSFIGYQNTEVNVGKQTKFNIQLYPDTKILDEAVVIGYGERRKDELSGAVTTVNSQMISLQPVTSVDQALQGMSPGVTLREGSGAPGAGPEILIRGINTFNNNKPLVVVDDVILENGNDQNNNPLSLINPEDIENVTILKDAATKAIYGSRATAGVILVTTKRGKLGKPRITFNTSLGAATILPFERPDVLNATELAQFFKEKAIDGIRLSNPLYKDSKVPVPDDLIPAQFRNPSQYGEGTNWFEEVTRTALNANHNISINGGNPNVRYYVSANYQKQEGVIIENDFTRYSIRANLDLRLNDKLKMILNLSPSRTERNRTADEPSNGQFSAGSTITSTYWADPSASVYSAPGVYNYLTKGSLTTNWTANPVYQLKSETEIRRSNQILSNIALEYEPIKNLFLKTKLSYGFDYGRSRNFQPMNLATGDGLTPVLPNPDSAKASLFNTSTNNLINDNLAIYRFNIAKKNKFDITLGYLIQEVTTENSSISAKKLLDENFILPDFNNVSKAAIGNFTGAEDFIRTRLLSQISRFRYEFDDRYILNLSYRRDGSSRFGRDVKYGNFPAGSVTWRASKEAFLEKLKWLNDLRFEVGYGITGSASGASAYGHLGNITTSNYAFGGTVALGNTIGNLPNGAITWEEAEQFDVGLNAAIFNEKIKVAFNYFKQITGNPIAQLPVSWATGFGSVVGNQQGKISNKGFEASVEYVPIRTKNFRWDINVNASKYINLLEEYYLPNGFLNGNAGNGTQITISKPGQPIGMYRGLQITGLFTAAEIADPTVPKYAGAVEGNIKYVDGNGNGRLEAADADYVILGNPHPDLMFGMTHVVSYKGFNLRTVFAGQMGGLIFDLRRELMWNVDGNFNINRLMLDRWRPGDDLATKEFQTTNGNNSARVRWPSDNKVYDGSYVGLKNITLSYNLGGLLNKKRKFLEMAQVYGSVRNAFYLAAYKYGNPEIRRANDGSALRSVNYGSYPVSRTVVFGLNVTF